jgi:CDP-glycerol glycerophosphotransferase (TagB/SpsB family)
MIIRLIKFIISRYSPIWVFGSFEGVNFFHNSKALFLFCQQIKNPLFPVWITQCNDLIKELRSYGFYAHNKDSFLGKFFCLFARYHISDWGIDDINKKYFHFSKQVNLWHGIPLKCIGLDVSTKYKTGIESFGKPDILISCINYDKKNLITAFNLKEESVKICGLPRNDYMFYNINRTKKDDLLYKKIEKDTKKYKKVILYLPTFDDSQSFNNFSWIDYNFNKFLQKNHILFFYKSHPADKSSYFDKNNFTNIKQIGDKNTDLYPLIDLFDILITDYSSILFDFALTKKRIIINLIGKNKYTDKIRNVYFDITKDHNKVGEICYNVNHLKKLIINGNNYSNIILEKYHDYHNNFCKRIIKELT